MGVRLREGILDVGLGGRLLTPRTQSPDSGRGADAERKGVQEGVRGDGPTTSRMRGTSKGARGGRFFPAVAATTRVRGRVLRFECVKEVLLGTKFEARVLRGGR